MSSHNTSLGHIGDTYVKFAKQFYNTEPNDLTPLLDYLPDLKLDSKYVLDDFRPSEQTNSVLWLYIISYSPITSNVAEPPKPTLTPSISPLR